MSENFIWKERRRIGRFFKHTDPVLKVVSVTDFALEEICETQMTIPDNALGSIIHVGLHEASMLSRGIKPSKDLNRDLATPETRRPVLRPLDFTGEWRRMRARQQGRSAKQDEEDEMEIEAEQSRKRDAAKNVPRATSPIVTATPVVATPGEVLAGALDAGPNEDLRAAGFSAAENSSALKIQRKMMDTAAPLIDPGFVPMAGGPQGSNPEHEAIEQYHEELTEKRMQASASGAAAEEAGRRGFEEGYRAGEERAIQEAQSVAQESVALVNKLVTELETQKRAVLANAQENFQVLTKALISALIQKEFSANPESLATVVQRAIAETVTDDQFTVHLHTQTLAAMIPFADDKLKARLVANDSVNPGEFRIEAKLSVVDGKIDQIVKDLLDQADLNLFDLDKTKDKAG